MKETKPIGESLKPHKNHTATTWVLALALQKLQSLTPLGSGRVERGIKSF